LSLYINALLDLSGLQ